MSEKAEFFTLGELLDICHGFPFPGRYFSGAETGRILLTPGNIQPGGGFNYRKLRYYSEKGPCPGEFLLAPGEIVIALTDLSSGGNILGCPARLPTMADKVFLHNQRLGRIILRSALVEPGYIYWLLRGDGYLSHAGQRATGSTVKHTAPDRLLSYRFHIPPAEKRRVEVNLLDALEKRIELFDEQERLLWRCIREVFRRRFSQALSFPALRPLPGGWSEVKIMDLGRIVCGRTPSRSEAGYYGGEIPFVKIPDMRDGVYIVSTRETLSHKGADSQHNLILPAGAICVSCIATVGLTAITTRPCYTNQQINAVIPREEHLRYYLYCIMKEMKRSLENEASSGSITANLSTGRFGAITVPLPPSHMLLEFSRDMEAGFARLLCNAVNRENVQKMMRGFIRRFFPAPWR